MTSEVGGPVVDCEGCTDGRGSGTVGMHDVTGVYA